MDWWSLLGLVLGVVAGVATALYFARRSSKELRREAEGLRRESEKLRKHTTLIMRGLEEAGLVQYNRVNGEIEGIQIKREFFDTVGVSDVDIGLDVQRQGAAEAQEGTDHTYWQRWWRRIFGA